MKVFGKMALMVAIPLLLLLLTAVGEGSPGDPGTPQQVPRSTEVAVDEADAVQASPEEAEGERLGRSFGRFDRATWELVAECWPQGEGCIDAVELHMDEHRPQLKKLLGSASAVRCESKGPARVSIQVSDGAVGESYRTAYALETAAVEAIRYGASDDPDQESVVRRVRAMEREFRTGLCQEILDETRQNRRQLKEPGERAQKRETAVF